MSISFHHVDELPSPRPSNMLLIDRKSILASVTAVLACEDPAHTHLLQYMISGLAPSGGRPCTAETFLPRDGGEEGQPQRVALCALPEECSRHNSPPQPHAIADYTCSLSGGGNGVAIIMCLFDPSHAFAAGCAVARAFPLYSNTSRKRSAGASSPATFPLRKIAVYLRVPNKTWPNVRRVLTAAAEGIQLTARLVDTPPNFLHTSAFVEEAISVARGLGDGVTIKVIRGSDLAAQGFGGLYGVGKAAVEPPALVVLSHVVMKGSGVAEGGSGPDSRNASPVPTGQEGEAGSVCLVGKGIVYDTGGLSIKATTGMPGMKRDMGGAAAVLAAFQAAVKTRAAPEVGTTGQKGCRSLHALLCLAENSVASNATRPDDVHTLYSGRTVEVNNTDAEGRLVLSDGVAYAARHLSPAVIIDIATLTGAQGVTSGRRHASVLSNDEGLETMAVACGRSSGDLVHPVIYCPEFFTEEFRSSVADMKNSVTDRSNAQVSCAGQFIANHIEDFVAGPAAGGGRWLHIDMASPAHQGERATGYGVALLLSLVRELDLDFSDVAGSCSVVRGVDEGGIVIDVGGGDTGYDSRPAAGIGGGNTGDGGGAVARGGKGRCYSRPIGDPAFVVPPQAYRTLTTIAPKFGICWASLGQQRLWNPELFVKPFKTRRAPSMCQECGHDPSSPEWKHIGGGAGGKRKCEVPVNRRRKADKPNRERNRYLPCPCTHCCPG